jgi:hypothetical protein
MRTSRVSTLVVVFVLGCANPFSSASSGGHADATAEDESGAGGSCVTGELVVSTTSAAGLALTVGLGTDSYVYWSEGHRVRRRAIAGGDTQDLVTLLGTPLEVAVAGEYVYFTAQGSTTTSGRQVSLGRASREGGPVTWLVEQTDTDFVVARSFAVDGDTVYFASEDGTVRAVGAKNGVIATYTESHPPQHVAVGGPQPVYTVFEGIVAGVDGTVYVKGDLGASAIAANATDIYYGADGLKQVSFAASDAHTVVSGIRIDQLALDDRYVYVDAGSSVGRVALGGTNLETFACMGGVTAIALSPTHLYALMGDGIRRYPKGYTTAGATCAAPGSSCATTTCCDGASCDPTTSTCTAGCTLEGRTCAKSADCCTGGCGTVLGSTGLFCQCLGSYVPCRTNADCCSPLICDSASKQCKPPTPTCTPPKVLCSDTCADLNNDFNNCGACGRVCLAGPGNCYLGACHSDCRGTDSLCSADCSECCSKRCVAEGSTHRCVP